MRPDRVVIGVSMQNSGTTFGGAIRSLYAPLAAPVLITDLTTAEMIKMASNVFLAAKVTFANEVARLSAALGADTATVVDGMGLDRRIGRAFLSPGPGFGGSCLPSQSIALPDLARSKGVVVELMGSIAPSNEHHADWLLNGIEAAMGLPLDRLGVALLGLTYKAGTDDLRDSPAMRLATKMVDRNANVTVFDPIATTTGVVQLAASGVVVTPAYSVREACAGADLVVIATEWPEFRGIDWAALAPAMHGRLIADARRIVDEGEAMKAGFQVLALGSPVGSSGPFDDFPLKGRTERASPYQRTRE
jgi:UDPglucose 6-dehydrogenase